MKVATVGGPELTRMLALYRVSYSHDLMVWYHLRMTAPAAVLVHDGKTWLLVEPVVVNDIYLCGTLVSCWCRSILMEQ